MVVKDETYNHIHMDMVVYKLTIIFFWIKFNMTTKLKKYPTFSDKGWVSNPLEKLDNLFSHAFAAEYGQSYLDYDILDLHSLIASINSDVTIGLDKLSKSITDYLMRHFPEKVDCEAYEEDNQNNSSGITIVLLVTVWEDGIPYTINKLLNIIDGKFKIMLNIHNTGNEKGI
jgi:hypothetical protein